MRAGEVPDPDVHDPRRSRHRRPAEAIKANRCHLAATIPVNQISGIWDRSASYGHQAR
jgi:hypothetical protein